MLQISAHQFVNLCNRWTFFNIYYKFNTVFIPKRKGANCQMHALWNVQCFLKSKSKSGRKFGYIVNVLITPRDFGNN